MLKEIFIYIDQEDVPAQALKQEQAIMVFYLMDSLGDRRLADMELSGGLGLNVNFSIIAKEGVRPDAMPGLGLQVIKDLHTIYLQIIAMFVSPITKLIQHFYQRVSPVRQGIFDFWRYLRIHFPVD